MASVDAEPRGERRVHRPLVSIGAVCAVVLAVDQFTKWWAVSALESPPRTIDLVWTLRFRLIYNRGTAFSLTSDSGPIVSVIALLVVGFLLYSGRDQRSRAVVTGYGLIVGGTLGNLVDRIARDGDGFLRGGVVDFVDLQWFPVFNVADAALSVGIGLLLVLGFFSDTFDRGSVGPDGPRRSSIAPHSSSDPDRDSDAEPDDPT